ncbi:sugar transferase [Chryseobacterium caseinilyticum]|uniref:Sugar transferase n=1 Tax=Chryseobacterium caseinilyticum TaxID=2771428 RepID=A0ABR8ZAF0_9FLAO|nr:sugar transferase [Chryseobacterium caseinilyticum]MBD8082222.1 sugar transferase [Chryseobacterium caseinilyticum]
MKVSKLTNFPKRYLIVNVSDISYKIMKETDFLKDNKVIFFDTNVETRSISDYIVKLKIKNVIIDTTNVNHISEKVTNEIIESKIKGVKIYDAQNFYEVVSKRIPLVKFSSNEYLADNVFTIGLDEEDIFFKRIFDVVVSLLLLPVTLPFIAFGALLIFVNSPGNVIFSQVRVGKNSVPFKIFKLRTMTNFHNGTFTTKNDHRLLKVGKFLRKTKIDELPQIFNVLNGSMSLIGPRPEREKFVTESIKDNAYFDLRHLVKPGISGWAQVHLPKATPKENLKKLEYDLYYIKNYNLKLDFLIFFKTIKVVFTLNSH